MKGDLSIGAGSDPTRDREADGLKVKPDTGEGPAGRGLSDTVRIEIDFSRADRVFDSRVERIQPRIFGEIRNFENALGGPFLGKARSGIGQLANGPFWSCRLETRTVL